MGSNDDTYVTNSMLPGQDPEGSPAAKKTPSDSTGRANGSGLSRLASFSRHEEQSLKGRREVLDGPVGPDDGLIDETIVPDKEPKNPSIGSMSSGHALFARALYLQHFDGVDLVWRIGRYSDGSNGSNGRGAPSSWPLTQEEKVQNLKNNLRCTFFSNCSDVNWANILANWLGNKWFARVVAKLSDNPSQDNPAEEIKDGPDQELLPCWRKITPLHVAIMTGDLEIVEKILEEIWEMWSKQLDWNNEDSFEKKKSNKKDIGNKTHSALDLAIKCGEIKIVDAILAKNPKFNNGYRGSLQWAVLCSHQPQKTFEIIQSFVRNGIKIDDKDQHGNTALYLAIENHKTDNVKELLKWKDKIQLNEACEGGGRPPIQIAHEKGFRDIEIALMQCDDVRMYIESSFRDRQAYVDGANAILVGAALIASVTFASWLQPPLSYTTSYPGSSLEYVDVEHNLALGMFWVFNTLSFYFAIGTVVFGAYSVLPRRHVFIGENVKKLSKNLSLTSIFLAFSVLFVMIAFGIAGFIVLIPILRYQWYMIAPMILGFIVCIGSLGYLIKSLWKNRQRTYRNTGVIDVYYC